MIPDPTPPTPPSAKHNEETGLTETQMEHANAIEKLRKKIMKTFNIEVESESQQQEPLTPETKRTSKLTEQTRLEQAI